VSDVLVDAEGDLRGDLLVASFAAASAVTLSLLTQVLLDIPVGPIARLSPLLVYPLYALFGRGDTGSVVEDPRLWAGASVLVAVGVLVVAVS
jgi:hypothetical protein